MKLVSLSLRQWRTFEHCDIEFPDGLIGIRGQNGAGKTTLAEAIGWALFGKIRAGGRMDDLRRQDAPRGEPSAVELVFRIGPTLYRVERVVRGPAKLWIGDSTTPETTQTRTTNARIALELDMTWDVFHRTVFARQKDVAALDPAGSADSRRRHVERLLGLERYRVAADKARADSRSIEDELTGRRAQAPDIAALEATLTAAEEQAADDDPLVEAAKIAADEARRQYDELVAAADAEAERAKENASLEAEARSQRNLAEVAEQAVQRLREIIEMRGVKLERTGEIRSDAAAAPTAKGRAEIWDELAEATEELRAAEESLAGLSYDPAIDDADRARLTALTTEKAELQERRTKVDEQCQSLTKRVSAVRAVASAGPAKGARAALASTRVEQQRTIELLGIARHELDEDRAHLDAVTDGGAETPCPVCLRPYGDEHEAILERYRVRINEREDELGVLQRTELGLGTRVTELENAVRLAERADDELAATVGPSDVESAEKALAAAQFDLAEIEARLSSIEAEMPGLTKTVESHLQMREKWSVQNAIREDRAARAASHLAELGIEQYDETQHANARAEAERLEAIAAELGLLGQDLKATETAPDELVAAEERAQAARAAQVTAEERLKSLTFDPEQLQALRRERDLAQQACDRAAQALVEARTAAQTRSDAVRSLRDQLQAARALQDVITERALELERHRLAAQLLTDFRTHQSQRAWPHLEQGASAILSAATDGRYADVRLSDDFRIVVVDRGQEHELSRFSGGEQDVTNLCLRLAIAEWVARERGAEINFVVLDEVFGSQDDERRQLLLGELRALGNRFEQLLVITHLADIADLCEHEIEVTLEEPGRSTARFISP